jgi:hypothetical protein
MQFIVCKDFSFGFICKIWSNASAGNADSSPWVNKILDADSFFSFSKLFPNPMKIFESL